MLLYLTTVIRYGIVMITLRYLFMPLKNIALLCCALFSISLIPHSAYAGSISIRPEIIGTEIVPGTVTFKITLVNKGDETARLVEATCEFLQKLSCKSVKIDTLKPNMPSEIFISVPTAELTQGSFEGVLMIRYTDTNGYNFSAITPLGFALGDIGRGYISARTDDIAIRKGGVVQVPITVLNLGSSEATTIVKLFTPLEFAVEPKELQITIPAKEQRIANFSIKDLGALPGSEYSLSVISNTPTEGVISSARSVTRLAVLPPITRWQYVLGGLAILGLGCLFLKKRKKHSA